MEVSRGRWLLYDEPGEGERGNREIWYRKFAAITRNAGRASNAAGVATRAGGGNDLVETEDHQKKKKAMEKRERERA